MTKLMKFVFMFMVIGMNIANASDLENTILLKLKDGDVVIELYPDKAPNHVARMKELARKGFYNGIVISKLQK